MEYSLIFNLYYYDKILNFSFETLNIDIHLKHKFVILQSVGNYLTEFLVHVSNKILLLAAFSESEKSGSLPKLFEIE